MTESKPDLDSDPNIFSQIELILLTILCATVIFLAVVGNAVVCILLRFRIPDPFRYLKLKFPNLTRKPPQKPYRTEANPPVALTFQQAQTVNVRLKPPTNPDSINLDPWVDECPSSPHECSCGKPCLVQPTQRCVIFTAAQKLVAPNPDDPFPIARPLPMTKNYVSKPSRVLNKTMRIRGMRGNSVTSLFLFNLSLADLLMALFCIPTSLVTEIIYQWWSLGENLCKIVPYAQGISVFVSALTHVLISWDRFVLVFFPLRPRMTYRKAVVLVLGVWVLALIIPLPVPIINRIIYQSNVTYCAEDWSRLIPSLRQDRTVQSANDSGLDFGRLNQYDVVIGDQVVTLQIEVIYTIILMILQYFLPLGVICGTYTAIAIRVKGLETPGERNQVRDQKMTRAKRKMVKMLTIVALMYGLSQLPRHALYLHGLINRDFWSQTYSIKAWAAANFARDSATCYNPFIYAWVNKTFRQNVYHLFSSCCCLPWLALRSSLRSKRSNYDDERRANGPLLLNHHNQSNHQLNQQQQQQPQSIQQQQQQGNAKKSTGRAVKSINHPPIPMYQLAHSSNRNSLLVKSYSWNHRSESRNDISAQSW